MEKAKKLFNDLAKKNMIHWNEKEFQESHKTLYSIIIKAIQKAFHNEKEIIDDDEKKFSSREMVDFGNFIRDNYYGVGAPKLISYDHTKYPHGTIEDIFVIWCCEHGF